MEKKSTFFAIGGVAIAIALWLTLFSGSIRHPVVSENPTSTPQSYECNADGKVCPDGSVVGRTGPACEFTACPPVDATSATVTTSLGQKMTGLNVTITPVEVVEDSRCPTGVQCIWAGQVRVRTTLTTEVAHGEHVLTVGTSQVFGDKEVTLVSVDPYPKADKPIQSSSYRFVFKVTKR